MDGEGIEALTIANVDGDGGRPDPVLRCIWTARPNRVSTVHIGILGGTGPAGRALAARLAAAGNDVVIGSRDPDRAREVVAELRERWSDRDLSITGADNAGAADADVIIVATPWDAAVPTIEPVADRLHGKIVISMANALTRIAKEFQALVPPRGSIAAAVAAAAPDARVAAAFHHIPAKELGDLDADLRTDVLVCSDHTDATQLTTSLIDAIPGARGLDAGPLSQAGAIEAFTAVLLQLNVRYRTRVALGLTGLPDDLGSAGAAP